MLILYDRISLILPFELILVDFIKQSNLKDYLAKIDIIMSPIYWSLRFNFVKLNSSIQWLLGSLDPILSFRTLIVSGLVYFFQHKNYDTFLEVFVYSIFCRKLPLCIVLCPFDRAKGVVNPKSFEHDVYKSNCRSSMFLRRLQFLKSTSY
jgi:hypothetical protein